MMDILMAFPVIMIVSLAPILVVWNRSGRKNPKTRKLILSAGIVLTNLAILLYVVKGVGLGYGRGFYRRNLRNLSEVLLKGTDAEGLTYLERLREKPIRFQEKDSK